MFHNKPFLPFYDNSVEAWNPQVWAMESLMILEEQMVMANLVHRDFENEIAQFGDIVNTRKPGKFQAKRKETSDSVTIQDATAANVSVPLDQHLHTSFLIRDGEESKAFRSLIEEYLRPAVLSIAEKIDLIVSTQVHQFAANFAGRLGKVTSSTVKEYVLEAREKLNKQLAPMIGRNIVVTPGTETAMLSLDEFISADKVGDDGTALREASLGRLFGFNVFMAQQQPEIDYRDVTPSDVTKAAYSAGATSIVVEDAASPIVVGSYVVVDGDDTPQLVTAATVNVPVGDSTLTISPGLKRDTANGASIYGTLPGAVNFAAGYAAKHGKTIRVNSFDAVNGPKVGQILRFGTGAAAIDPADPVYGIIEVTAVGAGVYDLLLDRPLESGVSDTWLVAVGPSGDYNIAFHRNAIGLVTRPLSMPRTNGALAGVVADNGLAMRVVITYDGKDQGHLVTVDMLCGIKVLDADLATVMYG